MPVVDIPFHDVGHSNYLYFKYFSMRSKMKSIFFPLKVIVDGQ